jgi:hypothetical protein
MIPQTRVTRFPQGRWVCKSSQLRPRLLSGLFLAAIQSRRPLFNRTRQFEFHLGN